MPGPYQRRAMPDVKPFLVSGVALGAVYALGGIGIVVPYRTTGVLNFAYGAVGAMGALISWSLIDASVPEWAAYLVCVAFAGLSTLLYGVLIAPFLARRDALTKATATLGFALILLGCMYWVYSDEARSLILPTTDYGFYLGEVRVHATQLIALGLGILMTAVTAAFLRYTSLGTAMRALANDREISATLGVPVRRVEAAAWLGSGLVCGAGALLLASLVRLDANALTFFVISALAAAVVARLRSLWVTLVAGLVIGIVEAILTPFDSISSYRGMTPFVIAIVALLWFGRKRVVSLAQPVAAAAGALRAVPASTPLSERNRALLRGAIVAGVLAFCLLALPPLTSTYWIKVFTAIAIFSITAAGLGLLYGRVGMVSLCQVSLLAIGGWVALRLAYGTGIPFPIVLIIGGIITGVIGVGVGLTALRLSGIYLALITLMFAGAVSIVLQVIEFPNGGGGFRGISTSFEGALMRRPDIATGEGSYLRYCIIVAAILFLLAYLHLRSTAGRAWAAIRHSEMSALAAGVNVTLYKLWAFALASFMTGVAGGLLAGSVGSLDWRQFPTVDSIVLLAAVLIGGIYSLWGAVVAGVFMRGVPAILDTLGLNANLVLILFGVGVIQVLITAPTGIAGQLQDAGAALSSLFRRRTASARPGEA
jgi:branched-subunit amino acid ABC-type transport system permease component